jgi:DNA polymerase III alpha subunit
MKLDKYSVPIFEDRDLIDLIYQNQDNLLGQVVCELSQDTGKLAEHLNVILSSDLDRSVSVEEFDMACQNEWFMPNEYKLLDIEQWLLDQSPPWNPEASRLQEELAEFRQRNMLDLLRWLKYLVDTCRSNNIVWGVGRGSSVASYVLYIIGVHKIDPIKYNLDWREFLR